MGGARFEIIEGQFILSGEGNNEKQAKLLLVFVLAIGLFYPTNNDTASAAFSYKKGDILITDRTSSKGVTGHAAIYIGGGKVLHTSGWKSEPHPKVMTIKKWSKQDDNRIKVLRYKNSKTATKAVMDTSCRYIRQ